MKIGFFQYDIVWRDREANLCHIAKNIKNSVFDLLVLPELFTSGYAFDSREELIPFGENLRNSRTVEDLSELMRDRGGYITGTIPELCGQELYNTAVIVGPNGLGASYRKIHLPDYEKRAFTPGNKAVSCDFCGAKVGFTICFDAWFAPLSSNPKLHGVDIICHSACFGGDVTPTIIPIRALENQCFYISCNRVGTELFDGEPESYRGESQIVGPDGKVLAKVGNKESLIIIDVDLAEVNNPAFGSLITKNFPAEHDKYRIEMTQAT